MRIGPLVSMVRILECASMCILWSPLSIIDVILLVPCRLGNLITDAVLLYSLRLPHNGGWTETSIAVWNGGGIRASIGQGNEGGGCHSVGLAYIRASLTHTSRYQLSILRPTYRPKAYSFVCPTRRRRYMYMGGCTCVYTCMFVDRFQVTSRSRTSSRSCPSEIPSPGSPCSGDIWWKSWNTQCTLMMRKAPLAPSSKCQVVSCDQNSYFCVEAFARVGVVHVGVNYLYPERAVLSSTALGPYLTQHP